MTPPRLPDYISFFPTDAPVEDDEVWVYKSEGLSTVGQDEVVVLLVRVSGETLPHKDILEHFQNLYEQAKTGKELLV